MQFLKKKLFTSYKYMIELVFYETNNILTIDILLS